MSLVFFMSLAFTKNTSLAFASANLSLAFPNNYMSLVFIKSSSLAFATRKVSLAFLKHTSLAFYLQVLRKINLTMNLSS